MIIFEGFWTVEDVRTHRDWLFIFGDNDLGVGNSGQAVIRGEPNAFGIPTKKYPSMSESSFYTDNEFENNKTKIDLAISIIIQEFKGYQYKHIVLPRDGLGTGLAQLPQRAPKTFSYLEERLKMLPTL